MIKNLNRNYIIKTITVLEMFGGKKENRALSFITWCKCLNVLKFQFYNIFLLYACYRYKHFTSCLGQLLDLLHGRDPDSSSKVFILFLLKAEATFLN